MRWTKSVLLKRRGTRLAAIQSPFAGIDLNDAEAVARAHKKAIELGEPLSAKLKRFCREKDLEASPRLIEVHHRLPFIVDLPGRKPILQ
ncbi:MAG: hypothetical protein H8E44_33280 [Planctomycetes bacterium]|nr:hypothetical protein [Planctomycetota bacterium]